ncbi:ThuA domain-containing protein [Flavisericum labens]|uniref:ThuA domain-containing protein n=1 Tax=Flavisericum labens TaxID=3377112 RepID=UPI00387AD484
MKVFLGIFLALSLSACKAPNQVLVFTKTEGFRHKSIEKGVETLKELGGANRFKVVHTEDANLFSNQNLDKFNLVVFLNTSGDVLNKDQEQAFKAYINNGGSFMGIHAASDTEFEWSWFGELVGAYFVNHPKKSDATIDVVDGNHPSTKHLQKQWTRYDEWYNFKWTNEDTHVLLNIDETTYEGGTNGEYHPIAWFHEYDGGRSFYTAMGHTEASYSEPEFRQHLLGGILYCLKR